MRERQGRALPFVVRSEDAGVDVIARRVAHGATVYAYQVKAFNAIGESALSNTANVTTPFASRTRIRSLPGTPSGPAWSTALPGGPLLPDDPE
mgnify:CR=1 FL=1